MSLHDIDKSGDRTSPLPNAHDVHPPEARMAHGTNSVNYTTDASAQAAIAGLLGGNLRLIQTGTLNVVNNGGAITTTWQAHGLSFVPVALFALNNAPIGTAGGAPTVTNGSLFLPTFNTASVGGVTAGVVTFSSFLYGFVDATNIYVNLLNATGSPISSAITYYLCQQLAQSN